MKVKEESEKVGLKLNNQKTKIMASGRITSCQIDGETMETMTDFIFGAARSVSLSWGAREVGSPCEWRGGARHCSRAMVGESGLETC